ncbi:MAG: prolipoprotein diacylglyceryl transferase, partial [Clostridia bacterium]|nr:prolipoprotein diacylglyceryl transferase [Clostridia bacterium]
MRFTPRSLDIFGFSVYYYAVIIAIGAILAVVFASRREKALGLRKDTALDIALIALPFGLIGARAYFVMLHPDSFESLSDVLDLRRGGLAIYGGIIIGALAAFVLCRIRKDRFLRWA